MDVNKFSSQPTLIEGEQQTLSKLNQRFEIYLQQIQGLADQNKKLTEKRNQIQTECVTSENSSTIITKFAQLTKQIEGQIRDKIKVQNRLQRAEYDRKFFTRQLKTTLIDDQSEKIVFPDFESQKSELSQLKTQQENQEQEIQFLKQQLEQYRNKLVATKDEYDRLITDRTQLETKIRNLRESLTLERTYHQRRLDEFDDFQKIHEESNRRFYLDAKSEIIKRIREDYRQFNAIQIAEVQSSYEQKLDAIKEKLVKHDEEIVFNSWKEENQRLEMELKHLESELKSLVGQNQTTQMEMNEEFERLTKKLPNYQSSILNMRDSNVHLWSEIHTYQSLLYNLYSYTSMGKACSLDQTVTRIHQMTGFKVYQNHQLVWIRI